MNINMYRMFFLTQKKHWWFVTKKNIVLDQINQYLKLKFDSKILDIGCGSGLMLNSLEGLGQTFGLDMSDDAIKFSKEIFNGEVKKGFLPDQIPYPDNYFDLITALDVIEHIDEDIASLQSMRNLLSENGRAIITVPAYMFLWSKFDEMNEHKRRYTLHELKDKLNQADFTIEKISYYNTLLFPLVFIVRMLNNFLHRDGSSDVDLPPSLLNKLLKNIFGLEKYLLRNFNLPFGVSILAVVKK